MSDDPSPMIAACACGACTLATSRAPKARLICHCTICQAFTGLPYNDVAIVPGVRATMSNEAGIHFHKFKKYRFPPPNLSRGRCRTCGVPVVETIGAGPIRLLFIPVRTFADRDRLPPVGGHLFYEHRQRDAADGLPTYQGYVASQAAVAAMILRAL